MTILFVTINERWKHWSSATIGVPVERDCANFCFILSPRRTSVPITSGGRVKTRDCQDYAESTRNTRNRLKMRGERRRGSSLLVTGVGGACFPARFQLSREMKPSPEISLCSHRVPRKTSMREIFNNSRICNANKIFHNHSREHNSSLYIYFFFIL